MPSRSTVADVDELRALLAERGREIDELRALLAERGREADELHTLLTRRLVQFAHVTELERRRIAAEIHDTAVQKTAAALLLMDLGGEENLAKGRSHLEAAVRSARDLMGAIHPPLLDELGLTAALRGELDRLASRPCRPIDVSFDDRLDGVTLGEVTELIVWRAMSDALRSSWLDQTTTAISVSVTFNGTSVGCEVVDDGTTPRDDEHPTGAPTALGTARRAAEAAGGLLESHQSPDGTRVVLAVPRLDSA